MRELVASTLVAALFLTGCSTGSPFRSTMQTQPGAAKGSQTDSVSARKEAARRIPLGKKVKVKTLSGETIEGTLRAAGETSVLIEKPGRHDAAPATVEVSYETMKSIGEAVHMGRGSWIAIAVVVGSVVCVAIVASVLYAE